MRFSGVVIRWDGGKTRVDWVVCEELGRPRGNPPRCMICLREARKNTCSLLRWRSQVVRTNDGSLVPVDVLARDCTPLLWGIAFSLNCLLEIYIRRYSSMHGRSSLTCWEVECSDFWCSSRTCANRDYPVAQIFTRAILVVSLELIHIFMIVTLMTWHSDIQLSWIYRDRRRTWRVTSEIVPMGARTLASPGDTMDVFTILRFGCEHVCLLKISLQAS